MISEISKATRLKKKKTKTQTTSYFSYVQDLLLFRRAVLYNQDAILIPNGTARYLTSENTLRLEC